GHGRSPRRLGGVAPGSTPGAASLIPHAGGGSSRAASMAVVPVDQCRVIVLHSALGLTRGVREFAELLRAQGCEVSVPDYYEGRTFTTADEGVAHRDAVGCRQLFARVRDLDVGGAVLVGFSLGASFVQRLARPGVRLAVLVGSLDPLREEWPGVDVQLHRLAG